MEEDQAIALLKKGNLSGLELLVQRYYFQAVRASDLIVQDTRQAEDIVQTAFLHASERIKQLSSDRFGPWFFRIVINASIKTLAKQKRHISLDAQVDEETQKLAEWLLDRGPSIEEMAETEELRQGVWKALSQLTARQRAAVVMKYYLEMSEAEVSLKLDTPLSTVKWLLFSGRQKLRVLLGLFKSGPSEPGLQHFSAEPEKEGSHER